MAHLRFSALDKIQDRVKINVVAPSQKISDYFGALTFGTGEMKASLSPTIFNKVSFAIENRKKISTIEGGFAYCIHHVNGRITYIGV